MASDGPSRDPRTDLPAAIRGGDAPTTSMRRSTGILAAASPAWADERRIFLADPDRAGLPAGGTIGLDDDMAAALRTRRTIATAAIAATAAGRRPESTAGRRR